MHDVETYTLGKGVCYFNRKINGVYQGYRDLGNTPTVNLSIDLDVLDHYSSRTGIKAKDKKIVRTATPKMSFTVDELNIDNLALMGMGNEETVTQAKSDGVTLAVSVAALDRTYFNPDSGHRKLLAPIYLRYDTGTGSATVGEIVSGAGGATGTIEAIIGSQAEGILLLSNVTGTFVDGEAITGNLAFAASANGSQVNVASDDILVCNSAGTVVYTKDTDYTVNMNVGSITVLSTGNIAENSTIYMGYACSGCKYKRVSFLKDTEIEGEFHFVSDNSVGTNFELILWRVSLTPSGDTALIGDDWANISFDGEILQDLTNHPSNPYGFIIEEPELIATTTTV